MTQEQCPVPGVENYMLPCLNKKLFGVECPGCGIQRSLYLLYEGEFAAAFRLYPAIYPAMLLLLVVVLSLFIKCKYAYALKMGLLVITVSTVVVSYLLKMKHFF